MITYKVEDIYEDKKWVGFVFRFNPEYSLLEEFFYGDVANFPSLISKTLEEAIEIGEQDFSGNCCSLKARRHKSTVIPNFGDGPSLEVNTVDLYDTVKAYLAHQKKLSLCNS